MITTPQRKCFRAACRCHSSSVHRKKQAKTRTKRRPRGCFLRDRNYPSSFTSKEWPSVLIASDGDGHENEIWTQTERMRKAVDSCKRQPVLFLSTLKSSSCSITKQYDNNSGKVNTLCEKLWTTFKAKPGCSLQRIKTPQKGLGEVLWGT